MWTVMNEYAGFSDEQGSVLRLADGKLLLLSTVNATTYLNTPKSTCLSGKSQPLTVE